MGKHLLSSMSSNHQGCMWGILHILSYHHWHHNFRNVFPLKKHYRGKHATDKRKKLCINHVEDQQIGLPETEPLLVRQHGKKWSASGQSSPKSSKKGSQSENVYKEENSKGWFYNFSGESEHLESDTVEDCSGKKQVPSEVVLHFEKDGQMTESSIIEAKKVNRNTSIKSKRHGDDFLEVLGVDKDMLLKFLQDLDVGEGNLRPASNNKVRLTKSGSVPQTTRIRSISPVTFEHKKKEIFPFHKGGQFLDISHVNPMPIKSGLGILNAMKQGESVSSSSSNPQGLNHKGWNQLVIYRFKVIKQKIKHALMELKRSGYQTSGYQADNDKGGALQSLDGGADSSYDSSILETHSMRRTSSLNESIDRYTQLFEQSFNKDSKLNSSGSRSLKFPNEVNSNIRNASSRNLSLPNFDSFGFLILHEALCDANEMGMMTMEEEETDVHFQRKSVTVSLPSDKDIISLDRVIETEIEDVTPTTSSDKNMEENDESTTLEDGGFLQEQMETSMSIYPNKETMETLEISCENNKSSHVEELKASVSSIEELETDLQSTKIKPDTGVQSDFEFVKDVIVSLGFMGNEDTQMWHKLHQLQNQSLLMDLDSKSWSLEIESSGEENLKTSHHLLLSNLVKEVLQEIYEASPSYFPRHFSFNRCLIPMNEGQNLLNEVWTRVNSYMSLRPELDYQTLGDVVSRDLMKSKGWMNLQQEEEYVALEVEEMILKDLLDEVILSSKFL